MRVQWAFVLWIMWIPYLAMAWQYPVKNLRITSLFGESRVDHFHNGIDFAGEQLIHPIEQGEMIYYREDDPLTDFMGIGNHVVVEHRDGIRSFYYHLAAESIDDRFNRVSKDDVLAVMGNTGKSFGGHLHLTIVDSINRRVLNPQLLLPTLDDRTKPIIGSFFFTVKQRPNIYKIRNRSIINYNNAIKLFLIAGDLKPSYSSFRTLNPVNARGLRRVTFFIDDQIYKNYEFDYLLHQGGELLLNNGQDFYETYGLSFNYLLGEFFPIKKLHKFHIQVEDWMGNTDVETYNVVFRL